MNAFTDTSERVWDVRFDYLSIRRVRESSVDIDLATLLADSMAGLQRLQTDVVLFIDTLYVMVGHQHPDVSDVDFGQSFDGDVLGASSDAFVESLANFCQPPQRRALKAMMKRGKELQAYLEETVSNLSIGEMISGGPESNSPQQADSEQDSSNTRYENLTGRQRNGSGVSGTKHHTSVR